MGEITSLELTSGVGIDLVQSDRGEFLGIGGVRVGGVPLRNDARPIALRLDTPDGFLYTRLEVREASRVGPGIHVHLRAVGVPWARGEYADDYDQPLVWLERPAGPVEDDLTLILDPAELALGGRTWTGFSYALRFRSGARQIHRLMTHATWEIGGSLGGNTVLSQGQCNRAVYRGGSDAFFTTACLRTLDQYGRLDGNSYQLSPRGGLIQPFDFQYAAAGALFQYWPAFASVSSLVESPPGSDLLHVVDEYRFPLASEVATMPKHVLFAAGALAEHEARDLWWAAHRHVYGGIQAASGVRPTVVVPEIGQRYSTRIHEGRLRMKVGGVEVEHAEVPYAIAEHVLPRLAAQGIRRFMPEVMSESDVTVLGMQRKLDEDVHGDLHCASVCATHRFFPSAFWGGIKAWKHMADRARALGIEIGCWFAQHLSPRAPIFAEHPEYRMIGPNGMPVGGGYGFQTIIVGDFNTGLLDWVLADLARWKAEGGLDYVFTDSWSNMGLVQQNYAAGMRTNLAAMGRFYRELQRIGIGALSLEGVQLFGCSRFGTADLRGDLVGQDRSVAGQNDFGWWVGEEDMAFGQCLLTAARKRTAQEMERIQFRMMANRAFVSFDNCVGPEHELPAWWTRLNLVYSQALPHMKRRRLLPDRAGVSWEDGRTRTVWTFREVQVRLSGEARIQKLEPEGPQAVATVTPLTLSAWNVYRITQAEGEALRFLTDGALDKETKP